MFSRDVGRVVWGLLRNQPGRSNVRVDGRDEALSKHLLFDTIDDLMGITKIFQVNLADEDNTALVWASASGNDEMVDFIISRPHVDPAIRNNLALRMAVSRQSAELVAHLMTLDVNPYDRTRSTDNNFFHGLSAMERATNNRRDDLMILMMMDKHVKKAIRDCCCWGRYVPLRWGLEHLNTRSLGAPDLLKKILESADGEEMNKSLVMCVKVVVEARQAELTEWFKSNKLLYYGIKIAPSVIRILVEKVGMVVKDAEIKTMLKVMHARNICMLFKVLRTGQHQIKQSQRIRKLDDEALMCVCESMLIAYNVGYDVGRDDRYDVARNL